MPKFLELDSQEKEAKNKEKENLKRAELIKELKELNDQVNKLKASFSQSRGYINNLHNYNELKDIWFSLSELIAKKRNTPVKEILEEFDIKNLENAKDM